MCVERGGAVRSALDRIFRDLNRREYDSINRVLVTLPHHHAVVLLDLHQPLLSPCWIKKEETSPGCMCVERGGAVRSALDRIFRDLNRREYDSINRVLVTLPLSDLQGYEDALPLSCC